MVSLFLLHTFHHTSIFPKNSTFILNHHSSPSNSTVLSLQDSLGGSFDASQALVGELSQVGLWDRVLSSNQVASLARCSRVTQGSVAPWTENGVDVYGGATKDPGEPCSKHSRSSQWPTVKGFEEREWTKGQWEGRGGEVVAILIK